MPVTAYTELVHDSVRGDQAMASVLDVDRSRISQRLTDRSLYGIAAADDRHFPRWQLHEGRTLPGLREVLSAISPGVHPLAVSHFFTTPSVELTVGGTDLSPAQWLATGGEVAAVVTLAGDL